MNKLILKEFQEELFYSDSKNVLLIENESGYMSLLIESNIYIDNDISTTVNVSFEYKTDLDGEYKTRITSVKFNYRPVPVQMYLTSNSKHLYIKNFKVSFMYNEKIYETDQDFFRNFNCLSLYTDTNIEDYTVYIDSNIGIIDEEHYNSMSHPLVIEAIEDGWIHLMPHNDPGYIEDETPYIYYKINDGEYDRIYMEANDNVGVDDLYIETGGNLEDNNPWNDYHHYVIPVNKNDTIYLYSPRLDRMVLVYFTSYTSSKEEDRSEEEI